MAFGIFIRNKQNIIYGISLALLLLLLKWLEWHYLIASHAFEVYASAIAIIFTALGIWLAIKLMKPKVNTIIFETPAAISFTLNEAELSRLRISSRELEVLQLMAEGLSNQQIAERLFVSLNTIKTHTSNLFLKMEVERRTQAIEMGKRLGLIP